MLKLFKGGIHPRDNKEETRNKAIQKAFLPERVIIPVRQHIGVPCSVVIEKGQDVKKGQVIAHSDAYVSSPIHASVSGKVTSIEDYPHGVFGKCLSIVIESDGKDEWVEGIPLKRDWRKLSQEDIKSIIKCAGIVGMGGAAFPTHVKLSPPKGTKIKALILNGAECEPYLTADYRIMLEYPDEILQGTKITMKVLNVQTAYVAIEDNKPEALRVMKETFKGTDVEVVSLPVRYPQGGEKMLIKAVTGMEVPSGGLPADVGVSVQNIGTIKAIYDAVQKGIPLIERVTTVTGGAVREPKNMLLRIGTSVKDAIEACGGLKGVPDKLIMGGPMMGVAQYSQEVPVIKGTSGILVLNKPEMNISRESNCIRCGKCLEVCPMSLNPSMLSILAQKNFYQEAKEDYDLLDCIECGCCTYVCPAKRNIVQYIKYSKFQVASR